MNQNTTTGGAKVAYRAPPLIEGTLVRKIISGGQTGVDRGALIAAMELGGFARIHRQPLEILCPLDQEPLHDSLRAAAFHALSRCFPAAGLGRRPGSQRGSDRAHLRPEQNLSRYHAAVLDLRPEAVRP